jgi:tRNA 2-selenouridine synthase
MLFRTAKLSQLHEIDEIIDVRTPDEFADDHIPGAINCPVLSNEERITVGTLYKQVSPFEARKVGAVLVAKNIAHHIETRFHDKPKSWKPLIYCWRGGQRSGAMSIILAQVGWAAYKLEGGYKIYRREVLDKLDALSGNFNYRVICGATGSGKSRLLDALVENGAQVLDLESLARHRGSVLGELPLEEQPSQKWFDTLLVQKLESFNTARPVYVEAESNKIGRICLPTALVTAMHTSDCVLMDATVEARVKLLMEDYQHFLDAPETLINKLNVLLPFHGHTQIDHWSSLIRAAQFDTLVNELLEKHYDPSYLRALGKHYEKLEQAHKIELNDLSRDVLNKVSLLLEK